MTVDGAAVPARPDLARLHTDRHARLQRELDARGVDGLVLLGTTAVAYATGAAAPALDSARAALFRSVAIVVKGDAAPHLFTPFADGAPPDLPDEVETALFRLVEDALAMDATVVVGMRDDGVQVEIELVAPSPETVLALRARAVAAGGDLAVRTGAGGAVAGLVATVPAR